MVSSPEVALWLFVGIWLFLVVISWGGLWLIDSYLRSNLYTGLLGGVGDGLVIAYRALVEIRVGWLTILVIESLWIGVGSPHVWLRKRFFDDVVILWLKDRPSYWNRRVLATWWVFISFGLAALLGVAAVARVGSPQ